MSAQKGYAHEQRELSWVSTHTLKRVRLEECRLPKLAGLINKRMTAVTPRAEVAEGTALASAGLIGGRPD